LPSAAGDKNRGTASLDRETIRLSNKKNPKLLFIPTASSDSERYWKRVQEYFGKFLKCRTDILLLIREQPSKEQIREKILSADIIYVGGGNTLQMMRVWCRLGVDKLIKSAYENGTVLSGISAASICWFDSGHSDSMPFYKRRINYALQAMGKEEFIKVVTAEAHSGRSPCSRDEPAEPPEVQPRVRGHQARQCGIACASRTRRRNARAGQERLCAFASIRGFKWR